jgi:hypothetical protein
MFRSTYYRLHINPRPTLVAVVSAAFMNVFKLLVLCIVLNIHLYNQLNAQDTNTYVVLHVLVHLCHLQGVHTPN